MDQQAIYTATVIFYHEWDVNLMSRSAATYTTTYSNTPGTYTLYPLVRDEDWMELDDAQVLALSVTITPPGGLQTRTEPIAVATSLPSRVRVSGTGDVRATGSAAATPASLVSGPLGVGNENLAQASESVFARVLVVALVCLALLVMARRCRLRRRIQLGE